MEKLEGSRTQSLWQKMKAAVHWDDKSPESKAGMVLRVCLVLLLVTWGSLILNTNLASRGYGTMASFLIYGDWTRGANLFAVCSVAIVVDVVGFAIDLALHGNLWDSPSSVTLRVPAPHGGSLR